MAALGDKNIRGLDVAMDDAFGVRCVERVSNFDGQRHGGVYLHRAAGNAMLQRQPIQKFHGDERASAFFANFVDGANIGMIQGGSRFGFALETIEGLRIVGYVVGQELQGHETAELHILGFVDHAHPATAEFFDDAEMRDGLADERIGAGHAAAILECRRNQVNEEKFVCGPMRT